MTSGWFTYYWYGCAVGKFDTALQRANGIDMFVEIITSNNDIRSELLNHIKADGLKLPAGSNEQSFVHISRDI